MEQLLKQLFLDNIGEWLSGEELSHSFGVTRAAIWKTIGKLRTQGWQIESAVSRGYRLIEPLPDKPEAIIIEHYLGEKQPGGIYCMEQTDSTLLEAQRLALSGALSGTVVFAEEQTAGSGRLGRRFESPSGKGIYPSMLLRLDCGIQALSLLTSYAGLAVCRAIEDCCGLSPQIKWPNDLILDGKKVCGILTRSVSDAETGQLSCALIGIGINVHQTVFPDDLRDKAISLTMSGVSCSRSHLAAALLRELDRIFLKERWLQNPPDSAINELRRRSCTIGREVLVISPLGKEQAKAVDIASDGGLVLQTAQGIRTITSGEVSVHGILGYLPE